MCWLLFANLISLFCGKGHSYDLKEMRRNYIFSFSIKTVLIEKIPQLNISSFTKAMGAIIFIYYLWPFEKEFDYLDIHSTTQYILCRASQVHTPSRPPDTHRVIFRMTVQTQRKLCFRESITAFRFCMWSPYTDRSVLRAETEIFHHCIEYLKWHCVLIILFA